MHSTGHRENAAVRADLPADSGRRGHGEILDLEHHVHGGGELDSLTVGQTQHLVVVQHCVHVLDPQGVDRPITNDPLVVVGCVSDTLSYDGCHQPVPPLQSEAVHLSVQFTHCDGLHTDTQRNTGMYNQSGISVTKARLH